MNLKISGRQVMAVLDDVRHDPQGRQNIPAMIGDRQQMERSAVPLGHLPHLIIAFERRCDIESDFNSQLALVLENLL